MPAASAASSAASSAAAALPPAVVMKADIEGGEFSVVSRLLALGVLCQLSAAVIEYHGEQNPAWRPLMRAVGAPDRFGANVEFMVREAGEGCGVDLVRLSAHDPGS